MKKIPQIILKTYLRRWPVHLRKSQFNLLTRYSWLKAPLQEIRDEFLPTVDPVAEPTAPPSEMESPDAQLSAQTIKDRLHGDSIQGTRGRYRLEDGTLRRQGNGYILTGFDETANQPVVIKYYRLPAAYMSPAELSLGQQQFQTVERLSHPDNKLQEDLRVTWPIDAIADFHQNHCYFLVMDPHSHGPTLKQWLSTKRTPLSAVQVRRIIGQLLQSLMHLHHQPVRLASDRLQVGLAHGNLKMESVLCVERSGEEFFYLSDLAIWENLFHSSNSTYHSTDRNGEITAAATKDLFDLGEIGLSLLERQTNEKRTLSETEGTLGADKFLRTFLQQLQNGQFQNAQMAWQAWLRLPPLARTETVGPAHTVATSSERKSKKWRLLAGGSLLMLLAMAGGWWFLLRSRSSQPAALPCCLNAIGGVPEGSFKYAMVENGSWQRVLNRQNLLRAEMSLPKSLKDTHGPFNIDSGKAVVTDTIQGAVDEVSNGKADFAIIPLVDSIELPPNLGYKPIAYDGLAVFVPYSYSARRRNIPSRQDGNIALKTIQQIYSTNNPGSLNISEQYVTTDKEAIELLEREILSKPLDAGVKEQTPAMLRNMLKAFEDAPVEQTEFPIGIASLSDVMKQCSIYPLAVAAEGKTAVQPLTLKNGEPISPETNLCHDKNLYHPNVDIFKRDEYPLAYPIVVVFPQDNRRLSAGQRFADLMRTTQVQQIFLEVGLVPIVDAFELAREDVQELKDLELAESNRKVEESPTDEGGIESRVDLSAPVMQSPTIPEESDENPLSPKARIPSTESAEVVSESLFPEQPAESNGQSETQ